MNEITFYYDPISPYAYLAFERLPVALEGLSYAISYKPVLFAAMLKTYGQLGPAEIAPKRDWTYRQVIWQAKTLGIDLQMPASHPFNPLPLLRLAVACGDTSGCTNRFVTQQIFNHVWAPTDDGKPQEAADATRLNRLTLQLEHTFKTNATPTSEAVKSRLRANTDQALQAGVFGVPSLLVGEGNHQKVFWGLDSLPMLREYLDGDKWFETSEGWDLATQIGSGIRRV